MLKRRLKWLGIGLLALVLVLLALLSLALNTSWGARFVLDRAAGFAPGSLVITQVEGTLSGPLKLKGIRYRHDGLSADVNRVRLDLDLSALFGGIMRIEDFSLQGANLQLPPPGPEPSPESESGQGFQLPEINLPVDVAVASVRVSDVRVIPYQGEAIVIRSLKLGTSLMGGELTVDRLELDTSLGYVNLEGAVDTVDAYQTDLDIEFGWRREQALIEGRLAVDGNLDRLRIQTRVGPPVRLELKATLENLPEDLSFSANLQLAGLEAAQFGVEALPGPVHADLSLDGGPERIRLEGTIASGERRVIVDALKVGLQPDRIVLETLQIRGRGDTRLRAAGEVGLGGGRPVVDLDAQWTAVNIPLAPNQVLESSSGDIVVEGTLQDYDLAANVRVGGAVPAGQWRLRGHGSMQGFTLEQLQAQTLDGTIQATGQVRWAPSLEWQLELAANRINPAPLAPAWPGQLDLALQTRGAMTGAGPAGRLQLQQLSGELRGRPVEAQADVRLNGLQDIQGELHLTSGNSEVDASGHYGTPTDMQVHLDIPELRDLYPDAAGNLQGDVRLTGMPGALRLQGELQGSGLRFAGNQAGQLNTAFDLAQAGTASSRLSLDAQAVQAAGVTVNTLNLNLAGTRADHELRLTLAGPAGEAALALEGGLVEHNWQGVISRLRLASERAGIWQLREPAQLKAGAELAGLERFCLASAQGEVCASGRWQARQGLRADLVLNQLPLAAADAVLSQALALPATLDGTLIGEVHVDMAPKQPLAANLHLETSGAALNITQAETTHRLTIQPFRVDATLDQGELDAKLALVIRELGRIEATLSSPSINREQLAASPLTGDLTLDIRTLKPLAPLIGPLAETDGRIEGRVALNGTLSAVNLGGEVNLRDFTTQVPAAGLKLTNGRLSLNAAGEQLRFEGEVASGEGQLAFNGQILFPAGAPVQMTGNIEGERFLAADMPGVRVVIAPAVDLSVDGKRVALTGTVSIPEATINTGDIEGGGPSAVGTSPDVIVVGVEQEETSLPLQLYAKIDVLLGDDIEIMAPGFEGGADGRLHISVAPGEPALGSGEVQVTGTYQAYGQDLTITEGRLLYTDSPLDNPGLQITAVRVVDDVTAGVRISGTAKTPELQLFSEPTLGSDAEVLSYLVLGKPLNQASGGEGTDLRQKATVRGAGLLAKQIGARLGVENVAVEETETGTSVLSIGRYLSPRLYLSYGVGILEPVTVVKLEYELSDIWSLEASSGTETRAGIQFEYEP